MTASPSPAQMHALSEQTRSTVDDILDYARRRALYEDVPLDKPLTPRDLSRLASGSITARRHRRPPGDGAVRERAGPGLPVHRPPRLPRLHPVGPDQGRGRLRPHRVGILRLRRIVDGGLRRGLRRERGAALARRRVRPAAGAGGVFVQGGTIGNLSALVAARDTRAPAGAGGRAGRLPARWMVVCSAEAHSSIAAAAAVMDVDILPVAVGPRRAPARRRGGGGARRARRRRVRGGRDRRDDELRDRRRHRLDRRGHAAPATSGCTSTAPTASPRCSSSGCGPRSRGSSTPTR